MAALAVIASDLAWQEVKNAVANANPGVQSAFKGLKEYLTSQKGNPNLQFLAFSEAQADAAGGTALVTGALTLYGFYTKKENSATDNWTWLYDDATNDGTAADAMVCLPQLRANEQAFAIFPQGFAMAAGVVVTQYATDPLGAVDGSTGADGFILVGA